MNQRRSAWLRGTAAVLATPLVFLGSAAVASPTLHASPAAQAFELSGTGSLTGHPATASPAGNLGPEANSRLAGVVNRSLAPRAGASRAAGLSSPVVKGSPVGAAGGALTSSFDGLNIIQERTASNGNQFTFEPPDQGLCAGNGFIMETVNDVIRVYSATGVPMTDPIATNAFYGYPVIINRTTGRFGPEPTDPSCYFDPDTSRWFHLTLTLDVDPRSGGLTGTDHLDLAVSDTSSPLGTWHFYKLHVQDDGTQGTPGHTDCPCIGDYPHMGFDANGIYLTTNEYPFGSGGGIFGNNFNGAQLYAASKQALAQGKSRVKVLTFGPLVRTDGTPGFTVWPADATGGAYASQNGGTEYFLNSSATEETRNATGFDNHIGLWQLTNTISLNSNSPQVTLADTTLGSETYGRPPLSLQKTGPVPLANCIAIGCLPGIGPDVTGSSEGPLDSNDSRMQQVWYLNGKVYGALDTVAQVSGNLQAGVAWFVVDPSTSLGSAAIAGQGYLAASGMNNLTYPALSLLGNGRGVMAFTVVGKGFFPSAGYALIDANGPGAPQTAAVGAGPEDGFCEYAFENCGQTTVPTARPRWGDYGAATPDGAGHLIIASEYIGNTCSFAAWQRDLTCGGTRWSIANWNTRISTLTP